jgi:hypothetical protein
MPLQESNGRQGYNIVKYTIVKNLLRLPHVSISKAFMRPKKAAPQ